MNRLLVLLALLFMVYSSSYSQMLSSSEQIQQYKGRDERLLLSTLIHQGSKESQFTSINTNLNLKLKRSRFILQSQHLADGSITENNWQAGYAYHLDWRPGLSSEFGLFAGMESKQLKEYVEQPELTDDPAIRNWQTGKHKLSASFAGSLN